MSERFSSNIVCQVGPRREPLKLDKLPPENVKHWLAKRKAQVAAAVQIGLISVEEACRRYRLSIEELGSWQRALVREGVDGLKATRLQLKIGGKPGRSSKRRSPAPRRRAAHA